MKIFEKNLFQPEPVVWEENHSHGNLTTKLVAKDNDGKRNGAPFKFAVLSFASSFAILGKVN